MKKTIFAAAIIAAIAMTGCSTGGNSPSPDSMLNNNNLDALTLFRVVTYNGAYIDAKNGGNVKVVR